MAPSKPPFGIYIPRHDENRRDWRVGFLISGLIALAVIIVGLLEHPLPGR